MRNPLEFPISFFSSLLTGPMTVRVPSGKALSSGNSLHVNSRKYQGTPRSTVDLIAEQIGQYLN